MVFYIIPLALSILPVPHPSKKQKLLIPAFVLVLLLELVLDHSAPL
ncbi:hypothetical protein [Prosthecobacter sp.]